MTRSSKVKVRLRTFGGASVPSEGLANRVKQALTGERTAAVSKTSAETFDTGQDVKIPKLARQGVAFCGWSSTQPRSNSPGIQAAPTNSGLLLGLAGGFFGCGVFASISQCESGGRIDE